VPDGEPSTTLGLVSRPEETESKTQVEVIEKPRPEDFQIIDPQDIRLDTQDELEASKVLVQDALDRTKSLDVSVKELAEAAKETAEKVGAKTVSIETVGAPDVRLNNSNEASKAAKEAARITIADPIRALQSQAVLSVDTAMRVLR
jgi:hypothetical protein